MQPPTTTFDPYDEAETTAWLDAFAELDEDGEHGHLYNTKAGVHDFEFVCGEIDEWMSILKNKLNAAHVMEQQFQMLDNVDATSFIETDKAEFQQKMIEFLCTSMAYSAELLKEKAATNWVKSFMKSMEGGKYYRPDGDSMTAGTFDTIFVAVVGTRLAYVLITDED